MVAVVRIDRSTDWSSSYRPLPQATSFFLKVLVLRPLRTSALARLAWPLLWGSATEAWHICVPRLAQYVLKRLLVNYEPLSMMMRFGTPNRLTMPLMNLTAEPAGMVRKASTSAHLVNLSMAM